MISEVQDEAQPLLRFFLPGRDQCYYEWRDWSELVEDIERWQDIREHLLAVDPSEHGEALGKAQEIARSVNARLACIAAVRGCDDER